MNNIFAHLGSRRQCAKIDIFNNQNKIIKIIVAHQGRRLDRNVILVYIYFVC